MIEKCVEQFEKVKEPERISISNVACPVQETEKVSFDLMTDQAIKEYRQKRLLETTIQNQTTSLFNFWLACFVSFVVFMMLTQKRKRLMVDEKYKKLTIVNRN